MTAANTNGVMAPDWNDPHWSAPPCDDDVPESEIIPAPVSETPPAPPSTWSARQATVSAEWLSERPPPREYLFRDARTGRGALPARGAGVLGAAGGVGKGWFTVQAVTSLATKTPLAGVLMPERATNALIVSGEDPNDEYRRRFYDSARANRIASIPEGAIDIIDVHDVHVPLLTPDAQPSEHAAALIEHVRRNGPYGLVIIDPLARFAGASIDADNSAATALVGVLEAIATAAQGFVLGVHHTSQLARRGGIVDATALRGATALGDGARLVLVLTVEEVQHDDGAIGERLGEIVTLHRAKANHVRRWEPIALRRDENGVLMPLDSFDAELVSTARDRSNPAARRAAARETERDAKHEAVDAALRAVLMEHPGLGTRDLRAAMARRLKHCSHDAVADAIARAGESVRKEHGPGKAVRHYLAEGGQRS